MTVFRRSSFPSLVFLCFYLLAPLLHRTSDAQSSATIESMKCSTSGNYTPDGDYEANLKQFLAALPQNTVTNNDGFFSGAVGEGTDMVYGLAMCSADYSRAKCGECLAAAAAAGGLRKLCPGSKSVVAMLDKCLVRYCYTNFLGTAATDIIYSWASATPDGSSVNYSRKIKERLELLTGEAASSPQRFAASVADPPYALMQCTWDLPPGECKQCLDVLSANASSWSTMTMEGKHKTYSCTLRYSNTSFTVLPFDGAASSGRLPPASSPDSSEPLPPTLSSSDDDQTATSSTQGSRTFYSPKKGSPTVAIVIGLVVALVATALVAACWFWCRRYRSRAQHKSQEEGVKPAGHSQVTPTPGTPSATTTHPTSNGTMGGHGQATTTPSGAATKKENGHKGNSILDLPRNFPYEELAQATSNFNERNKLGQGAFGVVYEGRLPSTDMTVAIKVILETSLSGMTEGKGAFYSEIRIMSQLHHRNILSLKGWCDEDNHLLLIYEIMENGSLEDHLYPKNGTMDTAVYGEIDNDTRPSSHLSWVARRNILIGIASGLAYLHKECRAAIVHRDLKPANVMLDKNWNARLADFGLVTKLRHTQTSRPTDNVIGTLSYIDPAYTETGKVSGQCDVYSLGVVLLEIACGKKPLILQGSGKNSLIEMVRECDGRNTILDAADRGLRGQFDDEIEAVLRLGLNCVLPDRHSRPHTGRVRDRLTKLADGARSAASTSNSRRPSEEATHSHADEEAGISPLLA